MMRLRREQRRKYASECTADDPLLLGHCLFVQAPEQTKKQRARSIKMKRVRLRPRLWARPGIAAAATGFVVAPRCLARRCCCHNQRGDSLDRFPPRTCVPNDAMLLPHIFWWLGGSLAAEQFLGKLRHQHDVCVFVCVGGVRTALQDDMVSKTKSTEAMLPSEFNKLELLNTLQVPAACM